MNDTAQRHPAKELDQRTSAGLEITLLWSIEDDSVTVRVADLVARECCQIAVSRDRATYASNHPFAYAAEHGLDPHLAALPAA